VLDSFLHAFLPESFENALDVDKHRKWRDGKAQKCDNHTQTANHPS